MTPEQLEAFMGITRASIESAQAIIDVLDQRRAKRAKDGLPPYPHDLTLRPHIQAWIDWNSEILRRMEKDGLDYRLPPAPFLGHLQEHSS